MNIAFLTPEYPHPKVGHSAGLGTSIGNLSKELARQGHNIYVFVYGQKESLDFNDESVNIYLIGDKNYNFAKWFRYRKHIQKYVQTVIDIHNITILEVPDWTGISAFMRFSVPIVMRFHGSDTYFCHLEKRQQKMKNRWFEQLAVNKAEAFIAPTSFAGQLSKRLFKIQDDKPVATIHYGLQLENFINTNPSSYEAHTVLYIGTLIRKKGVFELPEILKHVKKQVPNAKLLIIGSDAPDIVSGNTSTWELLKNSFETSLLRDVHYFGKKPYHEVQEAIKTSHVCIFPSFAETLGMVTIESMALQKPVVNSSIGWAQELIIDRETGFLVHPKDHVLFAERIISLLQNKDKCLTIGKAARSLVEDRFDIRKQAVKNIQFYQDISRS
ncbi:glycosyltransferase family 4 protein [Subsaximicrobium wynnwilliamsii]|uniref:Glycosyltransferase family 4 protein n=1 Tax=Subsaximicrobium wynnwilliamsii TaxID=291179 RepID=A0A5C6ZD54_9FLAO|nr:glycosyltransferase family 4 protein [Subsaximicrobium wynnwilliamsii]TXD81689.1 glycosyltransferase family 4 protein [Subsaximicrobium wynnwilliamsii]TXD87444.1 glycosyltransferase family 4 protein [Subsaximicrobium wynnwilliamsii]TXE01132.1 glycosyltransferase family 4 protein [Subsaximicrobium wynnwilliamsii]